VSRVHPQETSVDVGDDVIVIPDPIDDDYEYEVTEVDQATFRALAERGSLAYADAEGLQIWHVPAEDEGD
jgi:hypothetical protein